MNRSLVFRFLTFAGALLILSGSTQAQWPFAAPPTPGSQRSATTSVRGKVNWLQTATRTAPSHGEQGYANVRATFDDLSHVFEGFKHTLYPQQVNYGANRLAELDAGLDILAEAFANYEEARNSGHALSPALREMCQLLRQGSALWLREFDKVCTELRVGRG